MSGKAEIIALWGFSLVLIREMLSGDLAELVQLMTGQSKNISNGGLLMRILGMIILVVILILGADASDDFADIGMWLLAGLTLLFFVTYSSQLSGWISVLLSGVQGGGNVQHH